MTRSLQVLDTPPPAPRSSSRSPAAATSAGPAAELVTTSPSRLRLGVSSCLLGDEVRYNGGHSRDDFLVRELAPYVEWVPLCPEVEIGLGTPRETIRLTGSVEAPRLEAPRSGRDLTAVMRSWAYERAAQLEAARLHGYVLKKGSPSCGLHRVRVYDQKGMPQPRGRGIFAAVLAERLPLLPLERGGPPARSGAARELPRARLQVFPLPALLDEQATVDGLLLPRRPGSHSWRLRPAGVAPRSGGS